MRALIVGTGFGNLYKSIYESMGWNVTTVDIADPSADYKTIDQVLEGIDIAHICTPNFTHYELACKAAKRSNIVLVEKPGVSTAEQWARLLDENPHTRFMMVKNNQYRNNIQEMIAAARKSKTVKCLWINDNRIPKPGSWFTNRELAFGGVSRDLLPHMLSLYQMFNPHWIFSNCVKSHSEQRYTLDNITNSAYGEVVNDGVYDVDDLAVKHYSYHNIEYECVADWRSETGDNIAVYCDDSKFVLGLCPEEAYERMIRTAHSNLTNDDFWKEQREMDLWIHRQLETM
jgi:predicted dehydrogenase